MSARPKHYLTPPELVAELLAPMALAQFYREVRPGGALDRAGFPAPVPWAAGRKKKYDRQAVLAWREAVAQASLARGQVDLPGTTVVRFPTADTGWQRWCEAQAERAAAGGD